MEAHQSERQHVGAVTAKQNSAESTPSNPKVFIGWTVERRVPPLVCLPPAIFWPFSLQFGLVTELPLILQPRGSIILKTISLAAGVVFDDASGCFQIWCLSHCTPQWSFAMPFRRLDFKTSADFVSMDRNTKVIPEKINIQTAIQKKVCKSSFLGIWVWNVSVGFTNHTMQWWKISTRKKKLLWAPLACNLLKFFRERLIVFQDLFQRKNCTHHYTSSEGPLKASQTAHHLGWIFDSCDMCFFAEVPRNSAGSEDAAWWDWKFQTSNVCLRKGSKF